MRLGKITENALKRSVLKQLRTEFKKETSAAVGTDCAFSTKSENVFSTIVPVTVNIKDAGYYGVVKAVNGLVSQGITPDHVAVSVLLPADAQEPTLKRIVADAISGAKACGVVYAGGHSEVTSAVNRPLVTVSAVGHVDNSGTLKELKLFRGKGVPGQALVITKRVALEGTAMLASEKYEELTSRYPAPFIDDAKGFKDFLFTGEEMAIALKSGISSCHDLSSGGVFAGLWDLAARAGCGFKVDLKAIPLRQETVEICEFFTLNPYELMSGGALLMTTDTPERLVADLEEKGIPAAIVGELVEGNDKIIINGDESRFLESPQADQILNVLS
ncbi:AIR synthase-related protein [Butyrivibrio sp. XBB1001]|uniref:AIR synthase-related protein n=1 Tax=Butyrivibrio sp. XBB1001 TaxID=1280682 RepID=UPI0003F7DC36|nr:AIR synthase-related protein [Butyrivibrio sp. XBB1001]